MSGYVTECVFDYYIYIYIQNQIIQHIYIHIYIYTVLCGGQISYSLFFLIAYIISRGQTHKLEEIRGQIVLIDIYYYSSKVLVCLPKLVEFSTQSA